MSYEDEVIDRIKKMETVGYYRSDLLEQEIITIIGNHLYQNNRNFHEFADALRIVKHGIELHDLLVDYAPKMESARKGMYFARNAEFIDIIVPGKLPEIGSAWVTSNAAEKVSAANTMISELTNKINNSEYMADVRAYGMPGTNVVKEMEGLDLLVNILRSGLRIDVTSIINFYELDKNAKLIRDRLKDLLKFIDKLKDLKKGFKRLDDKIVDWSYEEYDRIKIKYLESL